MISIFIKILLYDSEMGKDFGLLLLLLLLLLQVKPEITIYNYISHEKVDIRQRNKMMVEKSNF